MLDAAGVREKDRKKNKKYIKPFTGDDEYVDVALVAAAIAYYDMALLLMKPLDPNYATVANWKCNALLKLGQYEEAVAWYQEIIKVSAEADGNAPPDATAELAAKQLRKYEGRKNEPVDYRATDAELFDAPPFTAHVEEFINKLASGKVTDAVRYIADEKKAEYSVKALKQRWKDLVGEAGLDSLSISLESHQFDWKGRKASEMGWCYFSISGDGVSEGISAVVAKTKEGFLVLTKVEFGRP
jgi:tetratricopeptide (TPR) repeat protein